MEAWYYSVHMFLHQVMFVATLTTFTKYGYSPLQQPIYENDLLPPAETMLRLHQTEGRLTEVCVCVGVGGWGGAWVCVGVTLWVCVCGCGILLHVYHSVGVYSRRAELLCICYLLKKPTLLFSDLCSGSC